MNRPNCRICERVPVLKKGKGTTSEYCKVHQGKVMLITFVPEKAEDGTVTVRPVIKKS
jgi:hypothetical protein